MSLEPVEVTDASTLEQIYELRVKAWVSVGLPTNVFAAGKACDEHDGHARHWTIRSEGEILAAGRLCVHNSMRDVPYAHIYDGLDHPFVPPIASLNWMVTREDARGRGFSTQLDAVRVGAAKVAGCQTIIGLWSQLSGPIRLRSLQAQGFKIISPINFRMDWCSTDLVTAIALEVPLGGGGCENSFHHEERQQNKLGSTPSDEEGTHRSPTFR